MRYISTRQAGGRKSFLVRELVIPGALGACKNRPSHTVNTSLIYAFLFDPWPMRLSASVGLWHVLATASVAAQTKVIQFGDSWTELSAQTLSTFLRWCDNRK